MNKIEHVRIGAVIGITQDNIIFYVDHVSRSETKKGYKYAIMGSAYRSSDGEGNASQAPVWPRLREATGIDAIAFDWLGGWEVWNPRRRWREVYRPLDMYQLMELGEGRVNAWTYFVNTGTEHWYQHI